LEDASHEAVAAQQQAAMARRELAAATHREAILAAQAENAAVSAEDSKRALEEATLKVSRENLATASPARKPTQSQAAETPDDASRATARERLEEVERRAAALEMELRAAAKESGEGAAAVAAFSAQVDSLRDENAKLLELVAAAGDAGTVAAEAAALKQALAKSEETRTAIESDFQALMDSVEGLKASAATATGNDPESNQGGDADAKLTALEMENASLKSNLAGTEEACEGMQRELQRIQTEYNALASTLSGTLDTSNEEEEEEF
jgi:centrosomal protein CEP135